MKTRSHILAALAFFPGISSTLLYSADFLSDALKKACPSYPELACTPPASLQGWALILAFLWRNKEMATIMIHWKDKDVPPMEIKNANYTGMSAGI